MAQWVIFFFLDGEEITSILEFRFLHRFSHQKMTNLLYRFVFHNQSISRKYPLLKNTKKYHIARCMTNLYFLETHAQIQFENIY